ncbi:colicin E3-like toxin immunity protein [Arsenophonus sp. ENCA]|uniref:colicin E3-like toxin immunity protein n=1 Tax=Arsenophonus sp. ENCA TaxID=1987579 RepID=UPI0025C1C24C|nr:colicin E3-like toxin immunity protein [Arsenophonus sp. ENCA]
MGLRLCLHWFDKKTELGINHEYSSDCGDDNSLLERLGISAANNINNGNFDVETHWIPLMQPLFYHWINPEDYDYQLAFEYKTNWDSDKIKKGHNIMTEQYISIDELVGIPFPYPLAEPPKGWFVCHGQAFDKEKYPKLAKCYPDGKLPDLRGEFIRGWDAGRNVDSGRHILSSQSDAMQKIWAQWAMDDQAVDSNFPPNGAFYCDKKNSVGYDATSRNDEWRGYQGHLDSSRVTRTAEETRPRNISFNYIVKAA